MNTNKSVKILIFVLFAFIVLYAGVTVTAEPDADDPGIPWGSYQIIERSADQLHYKLKWLGNGCVVEIKADCVDENAPAPKVGDICERVGNQKFDCPGKTQDLRWTETEKQNCWSWIPVVWREEKEEQPPCCTTCQICYEKGYVSNGSWVKVADLGCNKFEEAPKLPMAKLVYLTSPYELKAKVKCSQPLPTILSWLEKVIGTPWKFIPMGDGSGKVTCAILEYSTDTIRWITQYEEYGCVCQSGTLATDPGGVFVDKEN